MASDGPPRNDPDDKVGDRSTERRRTATTPPPAASDDTLTETIRARLEHLVPELVRKTFAAGLGAVSSTEEGLRKMARDVSLPEVASYIASSADGARGKVWDVVARETRDFLANLNLTDEIAKVLTTLSFEIKTEVRFIPNKERLTGSEPEVKTAVRVRRGNPDKTDDPDDRDNRDESDDSGKPPTRDNKSRLRFWRRDDAAPDSEGEPKLADKPDTK